MAIQTTDPASLQPQESPAPLPEPTPLAQPAGRRARSQPISLERLLAGVTVAALAFLMVVFVAVGDKRPDLWLEVGKGLIELVAVVVVGTALKLLTERYQQQRHAAEEERRAADAKAERNQRFRQERYDALVAATNSLRKVPILIDANRSVKTWSEQMGDVIKAGLNLRMIKHQIYSSRLVPDRPFAHNAALVYLFEVMYHYTDWVTRDFADHKSDLSILQARAEEKDLPGVFRWPRSDEAEVRARKDAVWQAIQALESVEDMRGEITDDARTACEADLTQRIEPLKYRAEATDRPPFPDTSWLVYETAEGIALELITRATLDPAA